MWAVRKISLCLLGQTLIATTHQDSLKTRGQLLCRHTQGKHFFLSGIWLCASHGVWASAGSYHILTYGHGAAWCGVVCGVVDGAQNVSCAAYLKWRAQPSSQLLSRLRRQFDHFFLHNKTKGGLSTRTYNIQR